MSRRDGRDVATVPLGDTAVAAEIVGSTLDDIAASMLADAEGRLTGAISDVDSYDGLLAMWGEAADADGGLDDGTRGHRWARVWWDGDSGDEEALQKATGATLRCLPLAEDVRGCDASSEGGACVATGRPTQRRAIFAKAY